LRTRRSNAPARNKSANDDEDDVLPSERDGRARRGLKGRRLAISDLSPALRRFFEAAVRHRGRMASMLEALQLAPTTVESIVSRLRGMGLARTVTLVDPRAMGKEIECQTLVRLRGQTADAIDTFEAWCRDEPAMTGAVRICGRFDYQLMSFHSDIRELDRWRRQLEARPEVGKLEQRQLRTIHGHQLTGIPLIGRGPSGAATRGAGRREHDQRTSSPKGVGTNQN